MIIQRTQTLKITTNTKAQLEVEQKMLTEEPTRSSHVDEQHHIDVDQEKLQIDQEPSTEALEDLKEEKWNYPKRNILRLASVYLAFFNIGLNDASFTVS